MVRSNHEMTRVYFFKRWRRQRVENYRLGEMGHVMVSQGFFFEFCLGICGIWMWNVRGMTVAMLLQGEQRRLEEWLV